MVQTLKTQIVILKHLLKSNTFLGNSVYQIILDEVTRCSKGFQEVARVYKSFKGVAKRWSELTLERMWRKWKVLKKINKPLSTPYAPPFNPISTPLQPHMHPHVFTPGKGVRYKLHTLHEILNTTKCILPVLKYLHLSYILRFQLNIYNTYKIA